ncbi:mandelate racemase/muconate lactonizing enzyme family protein [Chelatococcus sp. GCM10030263]|uniref:mandelate racemase/muconate lactonizing enzyme family protein n=1 Tax=Chelatococcus sp. GCM10030263 TaxID=3273387 RepID=UPI00361F6204
MKIARVEAFRLKSTIKKEGWQEDEYVWPSKLPCFLVRVTADDGTYGVGEISSQTWYLGETAEQILSYVRLYDDALTGVDAESPALAHKAMEATVSGGMPGSRATRAGIDMAIYDLIGRARGVPVHVLLGGAYRTRFEMLTNLYHKTPESMAAAARQAVEDGFKGLKIKVGDVLLANGWTRANFRIELDKLHAALEAVPDGIYIDADANQGWLSAKWAVDALREFDRYGNLSIEQPLRYADLDGAAFVAANARTPVILDESVWSPEAMLQLIRMRACDRIVLKLSRVGGFYPAQQIVAMCEAAGIGVSVDTNPYTLLGDTACCHIAAAIATPYPVDCEGHVSFLSMNDPDPFSGGVSIENSIATLPDAPGLGIEVDWAAIERHQAA